MPGSDQPEVSMSEEQYIYNIGAVERMTGISAATLRAWERRYGFPDSERTEGRHRLYSDRQVAALRWVREKIAQGIQARQAIAMWRQHQHQAQETGEQVTVQPAGWSEEVQLKTPDELRKRLLAVLLDGQVEQADHMFARDLAIYSPETVALEVILPALDEIGQLWEAGRLTVSNEHLATQYLRHRIVMWLHTGPPSYAIPPVVLACAPGELHDGTLLIAGLLLRRRRWPIAYLGQSVPLDDLACFVRSRLPSAVVLVAMRPETAEMLATWPSAMPEVAERGEPLVGYGGRVFVLHPEWRARVPGVYLGDDIQSGVEALERYLHARWMSGAEKPASNK